MKKLLLPILLFLTVFQLSAQTISSKEAFAKVVFENIVNAYGSSKSEPTLKILPKKIPKVIAQYVADKATIEIDETVLDICMGFGKDSANALSIILSHELAHYYNDDNWCSDYAFAIKNSNAQFAKQLRNISKETKIEKESSADSHGLFYACVAGYSPFKIYNHLLDRIYEFYHLPDLMIGYPSLTERKLIATNSESKALDLYQCFEAGIKALKEKKFEDARKNFEKANSYIPFRENYNNIGIAKTLEALNLKKANSTEIKYPLRFKYPLEVDNTSRLKQEVTRELDDDSQEKIEVLLKSAQKDFEKAISLDPNYTKGYINLACVFDLLGNYNAAIGKIKELPKEQQKSNDALKILAIALFHNNQLSEANDIWESFKL